MKLEQTINRSQKSLGGIVGQTWVLSFRMGLVYHEILVISKCYSDITKSKIRTGPTSHYELTGEISKQLCEEIKKIRELITERGYHYIA